MLKLKLQYSCLENPMDGGAWYARSFPVTGPQPLPSLRRAGNRASSTGHRALARSSLLIPVLCRGGACTAVMVVSESSDSLSLEETVFYWRKSIKKERKMGKKKGRQGGRKKEKGKKEERLVV